MPTKALKPKEIRDLLSWYYLCAQGDMGLRSNYCGVRDYILSGVHPSYDPRDEIDTLVDAVSRARRLEKALSSLSKEDNLVLQSWSTYRSRSTPEDAYFGELTSIVSSMHKGVRQALLAEEVTCLRLKVQAQSVLTNALHRFSHAYT